MKKSCKMTMLQNSEMFSLIIYEKLMKIILGSDASPLSLRHN